MIVFKDYFKILKKHQGVIILYVIILLFFSSFSVENNSNNTNFEATKPRIAFINNDTDSIIVNNFKSYLENNTSIVDVSNDNDSLSDALFYQDVDAVIYIDSGYTNDYLNNNDPVLNVKYGTNASSSYVQMLLNRYLKVADLANDNYLSVDNIIDTINNTFTKSSTVEVKSSLDVNALSKAGYYYSFSNYTILAICIYVTAIGLIRFNDKKIKDRNNISSMKSSKITRELYLANLCFILFVWVFVVGVSIILHSSVMFTTNGLYLMLNSLVFMICALSVGFLTGNIFTNENAIAAVVNIVALGTSFICGSFLPTSFLPDWVANISKIFPSYWYIHNTDIITSIETFNFNTLLPVFQGMGIVLAFSTLYFLMTIIYNRIRVKN